MSSAAASPSASAPRLGSRRERRRARKEAARLPFGTFWIGAFGRAIFAVPAAALAVATARHEGAGLALPDHETLWLALCFAAPAAFGLGGAVARTQAYLTWGRRRLLAATTGALLGAPLGAFEALLVLVAPDGEIGRALLLRTVEIGVVMGALVGALTALLVDLRIRRRFPPTSSVVVPSVVQGSA